MTGTATFPSTDRPPSGPLQQSGGASPAQRSRDEERAVVCLQRFWSEGVTATLVAQVDELGVLVPSAISSDVNVALRAFSALAAMGRGDYDLADALLQAPPPADLPPAVRLIDAVARLYRACGEAERDPPRALRAMKDLHEAEQHLLRSADVNTPAGTSARGYAHLAQAEALIMIGDVGAARHQLEQVISEERSDQRLRPPAVLLTTARCILGGIEQAVGRSDLAVNHLQAAVRDAAGFAQEEQLARLLLVGCMLADNHRFGEALLRDLLAQRQLSHEVLAGHGTIAHLHKLLVLLARPAPYELPVRAEMRDLLRFLQGRHYSAGWFLLLTGMCAGALLGAGQSCDAYNLLVQSAATLRCRRMEGAADLCDRQVDSLRVRLGEEGFEQVIREARDRRREFLEYTQKSA